MQKNKILIFTFILLVAIAAIIYQGIQMVTPQSRLNTSIKANGIQLGLSESKVVDIMGRKGEKKTNTYGYEYHYSVEGLTVGFSGEKNTVRKISFNNPGYQLFGIMQGMKVTEGAEILKSRSLVPVKGSKFTFDFNKIQVTLLTKDGTTIDGISIEDFN